MGLPRLVEDLLDPRAYPDRPASVQLRQTHISYIFLTPEHAYKVKKPVDFGFLDFTTIEKRRHFCAEELRLNRRLTEGVYLDVVPITEWNGGHRVGGGGKGGDGGGGPVEYAVKMTRLPDASMLNVLVERGLADADVIRRVAARIAAFHASAETGEDISGFGAPEAIGKNAEENFSQTLDQRGVALSGALFEKIRSYTRAFLEERRGLFNERVEGGFIRDCHGDMHCDHISITDGINIFDCIEFNERFRFSDVASDVAFLSMDLDFRNRADLSRTLVEEYFRITGDRAGPGLLDFYKCYRAYVRGKVDGFKCSEPEVPEDERMAALVSARMHYHLSGLYAGGGFRPMLVVVCGLPGTGKSTVAGTLAAHTSMVRISSDAVRKELAGIPPGSHAPSGYGRGIYTPEFTEKTYGEMTGRARALLAEGRSVVVEATFSGRDHLRRAARAAEGQGAEFRVVECTAPDGLVRERLTARKDEAPAPGEAVSDADWAIYLEQKKLQGPSIRGPGRISVDTSSGAGAAVMEIAREIFA
ncbi:MAG: AAA family ATPase [Thermodesulfobacteriota bacterium]